MAEVDFSTHVAVDPAFLEKLSGQSLFVFGASRRMKYEDGKRTDEVDGTRVVLQVAREVGNDLSNAQFTMTTDQVLNPEEIIDRDVQIRIDEAKIWASSRRNSTFAQIQVSLHGALQVVGAA